MCGILAAHNVLQKPVNANLVGAYINQRSRGTQGFGIAYTKGGKIKVWHGTDEQPFIDRLVTTKTGLAMVHHRIPTSTVNRESACHPFEVRTGGKIVYLVHNGIIYNDDELRLDHLAKGLHYRSEKTAEKISSFNDSEALAVDFALYITGQQTELKARGLIAFIALVASADGTPETIYWARNTGEPLKYHIEDDQIVIGSEVEGLVCEPDNLYYAAYGTTQAYFVPCKVPGYTYPKATGYLSGGVTVWPRKSIPSTPKADDEAEKEANIDTTRDGDGRAWRQGFVDLIEDGYGDDQVDKDWWAGRVQFYNYRKHKLQTLNMRQWTTERLKAKLEAVEEDIAILDKASERLKVGVSDGALDRVQKEKVELEAVCEAIQGELSGREQGLFGQGTAINK